MKYVSIFEYYEKHRPGYYDVLLIFKAIMKRLSRQEKVNTVLSPEYIFYNEKIRKFKFTVADKHDISEQEGMKHIFNYLRKITVYSGERVKKSIEEIERMYNRCGPQKTYAYLEKTAQKERTSFWVSVIFIIVVTVMLFIYYTKVQPLVFYS